MSAARPRPISSRGSPAESVMPGIIGARPARRLGGGWGWGDELGGRAWRAQAVQDFLGAVAGGLAARGYLVWRRDRGAAEVDGQGAPGVEGAAARLRAGRRG